MRPPSAVIRELTRAEADALLARNHVGRIAFSFHDRVDIEPIHYVHADGWLYFRTSPGTKLLVLGHNRWVAFEVDEVVSLVEWRSVVVKGSVHLLPDDGSPAEREGRGRALELLRTILPEALGPGDPAPQRVLLFRVSLDEVQGRASAPG